MFLHASSMLLSRKRPHSPDISDEHSCERNKCFPTFVLESESPLPTDEDSESCRSVQMAGTVSPKDTSDTSWSSDSVTLDVEMEEYDVASSSHSDDKLLSNCDSSGTDEMLCTAAVTTVLMASNLCEDQALWADSSDVDSDSTTDSEVPKADYWDCVRCKSKCSPLNPYCLKCFQMCYFPECKCECTRKRKMEVLQSFIALAQVFYNPELGQIAPNNSPEKQPVEGEQKDSGVKMGRSTNLCPLCKKRSKNGGFVHEGEVHVQFCYQCSLRIWNRNRKCPLCKKRSRKVIQLFYG